MQLINSFMFTAAIITNYLNYSMAFQLQDAMGKMDLSVLPAWFSGLFVKTILISQTIFIAYQADSPRKKKGWVNTRNDSLIYGQIGYFYSINMACNILWLLTFSKSHAFAFSMLFSMTYTSIKIYLYASLAPTNKWEKALLCGGYFVYSTWLLAATTMHGAILIEELFGLSHFNCFRICLMFYISSMVYI